jgi:hypothetical protein
MRSAAMIKISVVALALAITVAANAGGPFDGNWVGTAPALGDCGVLTVRMTVLDGRVVSGSVAGNHGAPAIDWGFVQPNGFGKVQYSTQPTATAQLTFTGNVFTGWFPTKCGRRAVSGTRAP